MNASRFRYSGTPHGAALVAVLLVILAAVLIGGCSPRQGAAPTAANAPGTRVAAVVEAAAVEVQDTAGDSAAVVQDAVTTQALPTMLVVQTIVQEALPQPAPVRGPVSSPVAPAAVALIVRQEIISPAYYTKALQGFACPGDRSGPTVGIGGDLGMHTAARIRDDWDIHPSVDRLVLGSGQVGFGKCRAYRVREAAVRTPFELAETVFATKMLPAYHQLAARTFRDGWDLLPPNAQGSLTATVFVRGASMRDAPGSNMRAEMRQLRDECVPAGDVQCMARAYRAMCPRFEGRKDAAGLCARFVATAKLAVQA